MADITIGLPGQKYLSIDKIHPKDFLETWDALVDSRVINSLLGDEKKCECEYQLSGARLKSLTKNAIYSVVLDDIENCLEDGKTIERVFDPYDGEEAKNTFNLVSKQRLAYRDNVELDVGTVAFYAAKFAATFMWKQMKDNYVIGLKNNEIEKDDD